MSATVKTKNRDANGTSDGGEANATAKPSVTSPPQSAAAPSPFTPIADYAFLSECHTGALVGPDGTIDWLCIPRFDSASVFGSLLDRGAGAFRLGPFGINVPSSRRYEPGTNTLETTWKTTSGWAVLRDALTMGHRRGEDTITPHTRPPTDDDADHMLVRTVTCIEGAVEIELVCEPGSDYGRVLADWTLSPDRHRADATGDGQTMRLQTDTPLGVEANHVRSRHVLREGEELFVALSWDEGAPIPTTGEEANAQLAATTRFWRSWLSKARIPDHEFRPLIQRSALAIKGLTYMPTGATVAALTTSLPETPGGEGNWDYRSTWIRDSTFTLQALHYLNLDWEADEFMQFIADLKRNDDGGLQIMYGIDGRRDLTEEMEPYYTRAEQLYQVHWAPREHPVAVASPPASAAAAGSKAGLVRVRSTPAAYTKFARFGAVLTYLPSRGGESAGSARSTRALPTTATTSSAAAGVIARQTRVAGGSHTPASPTGGKTIGPTEVGIPTPTPASGHRRREPSEFARLRGVVRTSEAPPPPPPQAMLEPPPLHPPLHCAPTEHPVATAQPTANRYNTHTRHPTGTTNACSLPVNVNLHVTVPPD